MIICPYCDNEILMESNYCPYCDRKISNKKRKTYSKTTLELSNLEQIPLKKYLLPKFVGLGVIFAVTVLAVVVI